jgi:hypothetical protein
MGAAETVFRQALDLVCHQRTKSVESRVAMRLGRLWQRQGMRDEAQALLVDIYDWFTEGLDALDLREARLLLRAG